MKKLILPTITASLASVAPVAFANTGTNPRVEPIFTAVSNAIQMPERKSKRGSVSLYPFDQLTAVGMSFGVKNKTAASLSSVISNKNKGAIKPKKDGNGNIVYKQGEVRDAQGAVIGTAPTTEPETVVTAKYFAVDVDAAMAKAIKGTPAEGSTAIIFREL